MSYFQSLSMNNSARVESTVGEMVNLMSVDAEQVRHVYTITWAFVKCPLCILLSLVFLYNEVSCQSLRKHTHSYIKKISPPNTETFQIEISGIFHISARNMPRRGGSNEYP